MAVALKASLLVLIVVHGSHHHHFVLEINEAVRRDLK